MARYRITSSDLVHAPGLIAWFISRYASPDDRGDVLETLCRSLPNMPATAIEQLLSGAVPYAVEDETVVFDVDDPCNPGQGG